MCARVRAWICHGNSVNPTSQSINFNLFMTTRSVCCNFCILLCFSTKDTFFQGHPGCKPSWNLQGLEATSSLSGSFKHHHVPNSWLRRTCSAQTAAQHFDFLFEKARKPSLAMIKPRSADRGMRLKDRRSIGSTLGACVEPTSASSIDAGSFNLLHFNRTTNMW